MKLLKKKFLNLRSATHLKNLPNSILKLKNLKSIILPSYTEVFEVPEWIYELNWFEELNIEVNVLETTFKFNLIKYIDILNKSELKLFAEAIIDFGKQPLRGFSFPDDIFNIFIQKLAIVKSEPEKEKIQEKLIDHIQIFYKSIWELSDRGYLWDKTYIDDLCEKMGSSLSSIFKIMIRNAIESNDHSKIADIHFKKWLFLLKEDDLMELLEDSHLKLFDRLTKELEDNDWRYGFGGELDRIFFDYKINTLPPSETKAILDLQAGIDKNFIFLGDLLYDEEIPGIKIQNNHVVGLNISRCHLKELPESIGGLTYLETLDLYDNELEELPKTIGNLKNLRELSLSYNKLKFLPNNIGELANLERLTFAENNLVEFPEDIWKLTKIDSDDIQSYFFDTDGIEATALTKIVKFKISENKKGKTEIKTLKDAFKLYLMGYELSELGDQLFDTMRYKIRIDFKNMKFHDAYNRPEVSKFGGEPDVPKDFKWPYWKGKPLDFLGQINLSDINHFEYNQIPFKEGILYIFYDMDRQPSGHNRLDEGGWKIIYSKEKELVRMSHPTKTPGDLFSGEIAFFKDMSLPTPWRREIDEITANWRHEKNYEKLFGDLFELDFQFTSHWMFGYPHELQGPEMKLKLQLILRDLYPFRYDDICKSLIEDLKENDWILLLMLSPDYRPHWNFKKGGRLYFWIKKTDLRQGNFDNVWLIAESPKEIRIDQYIQKNVKSTKQLIEEYYNTPLEGISLSKLQIREFLNKLAGEEACQYNGIQWRCGGKEFVYARKILDKMNVPKEEQNKFLEICKEYGRYCDCEILMNAAQMLLGEETPW